MYVLRDAKGFVTATEDNHKALGLEIARSNLKLPLTVYFWQRVRQDISPTSPDTPVRGWLLAETFSWP